MAEDEMQVDYDAAQEALAEDDIEIARDCLRRMLDCAADDPRTIELSGDFARRRGDWKKADRLYERLSQVSDQPFWLGVSLLSRGYLALEQDERERAAHYFEQAVPIFTELGDDDRRSELLASLAAVYEELGQYQKSRTTLEQALEQRLALLESTKQGEIEDSDLYAIASLQQALGNILRLVGEMESAETCLEAARDKFTVLHEPSEIAAVLDALAVLRQIQGRYQEAESLLLQAIEMNQEVDDIEGLSVNFGNMAILYKHLKQFDQAEHYLRKAFAIDQETDREDGIADFHMKIGEVLYERGEYANAEQQLLKALKLNKALGIPEGVAATLSHLGVLYQYQSDYPQSERMTRQALALAEGMHQVDFIAGALDNLAQVRKLQGDIEEARTLWQRSLLLFQELGSSRMIDEVAAHLSNLDEIAS